jgi:peptide/nickel transport system permease protein
MSVALLFIVSILLFVVLRLLPGDPVITRFGATPGANPAALEAISRELGLDKPIPVQYVIWLDGALRGDFGISYFNQYPVSLLIEQRLGPTVELTVVAILLNLAISIPAGILSSVFPNGLVGRAVLVFISIGMSLPQFVLGVMLILVFSVGLNWLPTRGYVAFLDDPARSLSLVLMPAATLAILGAPQIVRYLRASMIEALSSPFVRTAKGKGVGRSGVVLRHALPNALLPTLTMIGLMVGYTLGGVVVVEYVFGWPGLGSLAVEAVIKRDYQVLQAIVVLVAAIFLVTNLATDLLYGAVDPRLRRQASA